MNAFTPERTLVLIEGHLQWSHLAFGPTHDPSARREGLRAHLIEELDKIVLTPDDFVEYADVFILAMDLAWRVDASHPGTTAVELCEALANPRLPLSVRCLKRELACPDLPKGVDIMAWAIRAAMDRGMSGDGFLATVSRKMALNAKRTWPAKIVEGLPINHIRAA